MTDGPSTFLLPLRGGEDNELRAAELDRSRSVLVLGETGSGKTEAIKLMAYQFDIRQNTPFVVFDYKGDYREFFETRLPEVDVVPLSVTRGGPSWNIFDEVSNDPRAAAEEFEEIGRLLFKQYEAESNNPYFPQAARQVFVATLKMIAQADLEPGNQVLVGTLSGEVQKTSDGEAADIDKPTEINKMLKQAGFPAEAAHLSPNAKKQAAGVYGNLQMAVGEMFRGSFATGPPDDAFSISVREYMANPDGRVLLLDFPLDRGETVKPIYRFFIDWATRFGLADETTPTYYILDEFQTIPGLEKIERLVNAGRAQQAYGIVGLQSVAQLEGTYGEADAQSILSGLAQQLLLRPGDTPSTEHVRSRLGREFVKRKVAEPEERVIRDSSGEVIERSRTQTVTDEEYPVSEAELQQFQPGEVIILDTDGWTQDRLFRLQDVLTDPQLEPIRRDIRMRRGEI